MRVALITGITGQDGSYLSELLLSKSYIVHGVIRRSSTFNTSRIEHLRPSLHLHYGDLSDSTCWSRILQEIELSYPDLECLEIYALAAQSHVQVSFEIPGYTCDINAMGTLNILEAIRTSRLKSKIRFYQASSSELYGQVNQELYPYQNEDTPFYPRSPYACSKLFSHWITINYRESYDIWAVCGTIFNHESPRRGYNFVTRKITLGISKILCGEEKELLLGNIYARRDWLHAKDVVYAMWLMLQQSKPKDYVIASGVQHSVKDFVNLCFSKRDIHLTWQEDLEHPENTIAMDSKTNQIMVRIHPKFFRKAEVEYLCGDATKAQQELGWKQTITLSDLADEMLAEDDPFIIEQPFKKQKISI